MTLSTVIDPAGRPVAVPPGLEVLTPFVQAGVFGPYEVEFAAAVLRLEPGLGGEELLALAVAARAPRFGHVCTPLDGMAVRLIELDGEETGDLPWPSADAWGAELRRSVVVAAGSPTPEGPIRPLVWDDDRLYLHRYWHYEVAIADDLAHRGNTLVPLRTGPWARVEGPATDRVLDSLFHDEGRPGPDLQRLAARRALGPGVSIIAGGPGTGKTFTVARLLAAAHLLACEQGFPLSVAMAAPTGKAAARMGEAVRAAVVGLDLADRAPAAADLATTTTPTTIHALLGWEDRTHFRHDREHPLPEDMVIIDETSMVSLPLMAKLLDAVRPDASVVLVGDPFQLASIEAGTVMSDLVGPAGDPEEPDHPGRTGGMAPGSVISTPTLWDQELDATPPTPTGVLAGRVTVLRTVRRFEGDSPIAVLADLVRNGDGGRSLSLLEENPADLHWMRPDDPVALADVTAELVAAGSELVVAAARNDVPTALAAAGRVKVLAATRRGPNGLAAWTDRVERGVAERVAGFHPDRRWHVGRPVLVTANDRANQVFNGDTGVVVEGQDGMEVALATGDAVRRLAPSRLDHVETWWAMTIHKSQGSEFPHVVVALPEEGSPILTRELLYTAVTRAKDRLTVVGSAGSLEQAIAHPLSRASGLRQRLWSS